MIVKLLGKNTFVLLIAVLIVFNCKAETNDQHIKVELRTIGHEFLLQINDSTTRVLPIEKIDGRYAVKFEREFSFEPDLLFFSTFMVLEKSKIAQNYIVEVEQCSTNEMVHSFEASIKKNQDSTACKQRLLPLDCYIFYFTVIEHQNTQGTMQNKTSNLYYIYALLILGACSLIYFKMKKKSPQLDTDLIQIGQYAFDQKRMSLKLKTKSIELSSKESELLFLLFSNENKTLEREHILNVVWGDEGNYVGRTLDVFISKLRKKLEEDPSIKIINVRGIGYRFVINY